MTERPNETGTLPRHLVIRLYIAGDAPNSMRARHNLRQIMEHLAVAAYELTVVDALVEPLRVLEEGILVTPTLVRIYPLPQLRIIGDLSDHRAVIDALGLEEWPQ